MVAVLTVVAVAVATAAAAVAVAAAAVEVAEREPKYLFRIYCIYFNKHTVQYIYLKNISRARSIYFVTDSSNIHCN